MPTIAEQLDALAVVDALDYNEDPIGGSWAVLLGFKNVGDCDTNGYHAELAYGTGIEADVASGAFRTGNIGLDWATEGPGIKARINLDHSALVNRYFGLNLKLSIAKGFGLRAKIRQQTASTYDIDVQDWNNLAVTNLVTAEDVVLDEGEGEVALYVINKIVYLWAKQNSSADWEQVASAAVSTGGNFIASFAVVGGLDVAGNIGHLQDFSTGMIELPSSPEPPEVVTKVASDISHKGASLNGEVDPKGKPTTVWFEYGETESYGETTPKVEGVEEAKAVAASITDLKPNTEYHFRIRAENELGEDVGADETFKTGNAPRIAIQRELPPTQMAMRIEPPGGEPRRWAEDEPNAKDVLADITLTDEIPGGCATASGTLARDPRTDYRDIVAFSKAYFYQAGVEKVWEGYFDKAPEVSGDRMSISPALVGNQKHLEGDNSVRLGFIDRDLGHLEEASRDLKIAEMKLPRNLTSYETAPDKKTGLPGIILKLQEPYSTSSGARCYAVYNSQGIEIGEFFFSREKLGGDTRNWGVSLRPDDGALVGESIDFASGSNGSSSTGLSVSGVGGKYVMMRLEHGSAAVAPEDDITTDAWKDLIALGAHGLTPKNSYPDFGFTAKQMLSYAIPLHAAPLQIDPDYMDDDEYIITQAWYPDQSMAEITKDVTKYGLYDWFVYFDHLFQLREPGSYGRFWKAYVGESQLEELGLDSERLWESIVVSYTDIDGSTRTVGPPGSGADIEDNRLQITDPDHPAVKAELTRRDRLDLRGIGTPETAIAVGMRFLEEANLLSRSGSATLSGYVLDDKGVFRPAAQIKSGDWISFVDASDKGFRKIVKKTYTHVNRGSQIDVDAPPSGLEALLERLQADIVRLGLG